MEKKIDKKSHLVKVNLESQRKRSVEKFRKRGSGGDKGRFHVHFTPGIFIKRSRLKEKLKAADAIRLFARRLIEQITA